MSKSYFCLNFECMLIFPIDLGILILLLSMTLRTIAKTKEICWRDLHQSKIKELRIDQNCILKPKPNFGNILIFS